jgi:chromatin segregation and condensation protein Rec8/ScpA/Scc1 (kleisin family)
VRRQNVAIEKISMAPIAARFLDYMRTAAERNLNLDIEWVHMAATLIQWKSRSLLPVDRTVPPNADPIREELVGQLLAHRQQAAQELGQRRSVEQARFTREPGREFTEKWEIEASGEPAFVSVWDLMQQARELGRWALEHRDDQRFAMQTLGIAGDEVTVSEMIDYLRVTLARAGGLPVDGLGLMNGQTTGGRRCCLFLGLLEMVKEQEAKIEQCDVFGPIWLFQSAETLRST